MKKIRTILAVFAAFVMLTACSTPQDISSSDQTMSDPFATGSSVPVETVEEKSEMEVAKEYADALTLTSMAPVVTIENSEDHIFDYNGGSIDITFKPNYKSTADVLPEYVTLGVAVTLNGIYQNISVNGSENTQMYIQEYHLNNGSYENPTLSITFDPVIAEEDKEQKSMSLSVVTTNQPHYIVNPLYPMAVRMHSSITVDSFICNVKSPISDYSGTDIGTGFTEELVTDAVKKKYAGIRSERNYDLVATTVFDDQMNPNIYITESGKAEAGILLTPEKGGKYRVYFQVNGRPAKLADGTDCIEVDTRPGYVYCLDPVELAEAGVYDTVGAIALKCTSEYDMLEITSTGTIKVLNPVN
ncbi:MAG: hypothetical protein IJZ72_10280 [Oscillospiraceae bacterium]|nr:hypothetical protein [Oscillospiraceae bacterium]